MVGGAFLMGSLYRKSKDRTDSASTTNGVRSLGSMSGGSTNGSVDVCVRNVEGEVCVRGVRRRALTVTSEA